MKKGIRLFIILCLVVVMSIVGETGLVKAAVETEQEIPEGYTPIYDIADLYAIRNNISGNYILMNDIDLSEATSKGGDYDCGTGWDPIEEFEGTLDGNGKRIIGMHIFGELDESFFESDIYSCGDTCYMGLFEKSNGLIKNLGVVDCDINITVNSFNEDYSAKHLIAGGIVGFAMESIENCYASGNISINNITDVSVGGLVGESHYGTGFINCYNACNINCSVSDEYSNIGGIVGKIDDSFFIIKQLYNSGVIDGGNSEGVGAICGDIREGDWTIKNCKYLKGTAVRGIGFHVDDENCVALSEAQMKTEKIFTGYDFDTVWEIDPYCSYPYPQLKNNRMIRVDHLAINTEPTKLSYHVGEELDLSNATVEICYEDEVSTLVPITEEMISGYDKNKIGMQEITVSYGEKEAKFKVEVKEVPVESVKILSEINIYRSRTEKLTVEVLPVEATDKTVIWKSSDTSVATVESDGTVKAKGRGTAIITATATNGVSAECQVHVLVPAISITLSETALVLDEGDTTELTAQILPLESTDEVEWKSSDTTVAVVDNDGMVWAKAKGTTIITATTESGVKAECRIQVLMSASLITLSETKLVLDEGESAELTAQVFPTGSRNEVEWESSDTTVVVVDYNGELTALKKGTAVITAKTKNGVKAECQVQVLPPVTAVTLNETSLVLDKGESAILIANVFPAESRNEVEWNSSDFTIATVDQNGIIKAKGKGTVSITATAKSGVKAECQVQVLVSASSIAVNRTKLVLNEGDSEELTATILPSDSTDEVKWESSDPAIATVDSNGRVEAKRKGTVIITVSAESGVKAECQIQIQLPAKSITLNKSKLVLDDEDSEELTATILPADSTDEIEWKSSNVAIAEVDDGNIIAKKVGKAKITAYTKSGVKAECIVEVTNVRLIKAKIKSVKNSSKRSMKISLSGLQECDGYQIQYATKSNFKPVKTFSKKASTVTVKNLKKGTKYYVRVRVYKKIFGKTYYGEWSNKKVVKIAK